MNIQSVFPLLNGPRLLALLAIAMAATAPAQAQKPRIIGDVRVAANRADWAAAEKLLSAYKAEFGETSVYLEALSWVGRGRLAAKEYPAAQHNASTVREKVLVRLRKQKLDEDNSLPIALGAAIEVQSQALNADGRKTEAVAFLREELRRWYGTSIRARIQKNLHLIDLEGKAAPPLRIAEWLGANQPKSLIGKPTLLFFWAHWCGDCKQQGPIIARLVKEFSPRGLRAMAPTQPYGYVEKGEEAPRAQELEYIETVRSKYYPELSETPIPVSEENFKLWGCSTTPTLALVDQKGIVRLYHPGRMSYEDLRAAVEKVLRH